MDVNMQTKKVNKNRYVLDGVMKVSFNIKTRGIYAKIFQNSFFYAKIVGVTC